MASGSRSRAVARRHRGDCRSAGGDPRSDRSHRLAAGGRRRLLFYPCFRRSHVARIRAASTRRIDVRRSGSATPHAPVGGCRHVNAVAGRPVSVRGRTARHRCMAHAPVSRVELDARKRRRDILLGSLLLFGWPTSTWWGIGVLVGMNLLIAGGTNLSISLACRRQQR